MEPAGPMETVDWLHAREGINNRLDALERTGRNHAQAMYALEVQQNRANQTQEEVTRGFNQASKLVNTSSKQVTHLGNIVGATNEND